MNDSDLAKRLRKLSVPLHPIATGKEARLEKIPDIRCVLFDVYGTLVVSGSGDVGTAGVADQQDALEESMSACGLAPPGDPMPQADRITQMIKERHAKAKAKGLDYPEVEIMEIWEALLLEAGRAPVPRETVKELAIEYESRINPVWPMPGLEEVLTVLHARNILMGIVSNAQFYTPLLFPALTERTYMEWGFKEELCVWSYKHGEGKPSKNLFRVALTVLDEWGVQPDQVLYVGNDMRNDIWPASALGCRTALFAGDKRSLRLREEDPDVKAVEPSLLLTELAQLLECLA